MTQQETLEDRLINLFFSLQLTETSLIIIDRPIGAGYIIYGENQIFARWGTYQEGIQLLQAYKDAASTPNI